MKIFLEKAIFINRAPFEKLELDFSENEISVLSAVNGKGKTTIISHIVDAFHEIARSYFINEYEGRENELYRISSVVHNLDMSKPSFVYLRFKLADDSNSIDYLDIRNNCTNDEYEDAIKITNKISFSQFKDNLASQKFVKLLNPKFENERNQILFKLNLLTYFPAYRYEQPGYLNDAYRVKMDFKKLSDITGYLPNPIEVVAGLPQLANWIMDVLLDMQYKDDSSVLVLKNNIDEIITKALRGKFAKPLRFGVGKRNFGGTRLQITENNKSEVKDETIYPSIFNLSSGENALLCLFGELLRQADNISNNIKLENINGIVLIDEIDKHLHIKLQKEILPELFRLFPNIQFIVSSHSPFLSMGLAEVIPGRSKIVDLDNMGISKDPTTNKLYKEVYEMMVGENERFKEMYKGLLEQIDSTKKLQIISEGNNTQHIEKAIKVLDHMLLNEIKIIKGAENKSGMQQLKNAFEIMSKANHSNKFLFVWDCDAMNVVKDITESDKFYKFCFAVNNSNTVAKKGIENLYSKSLFSKDLYVKRSSIGAYGEKDERESFDKVNFLKKIDKKKSKIIFKNFKPLIEKIKEILNSKNS